MVGSGRWAVVGGKLRVESQPARGEQQQSESSAETPGMGERVVGLGDEGGNLGGTWVGTWDWALALGRRPRRAYAANRPRAHLVTPDTNGRPIAEGRVLRALPARAATRPALIGRDWHTHRLEQLEQNVSDCLFEPVESFCHALTLLLSCSDLLRAP